MNALRPAKPLGMARAKSIRSHLAHLIGTGQATVRPHPSGGHTLALPVPGTLTARVYCGQYNTPAAALSAARAVGRLEGEQPLAQIRSASA